MDAVVSGCGIWATHFIAMLAYDPGAGATYSVGITVLSLAFAVAITALGLAVALSDIHRRAVAIGGAVVGIGVAAMHYTGMMALEIPALIIWSPRIVVASILFGSVFAALALSVAARRENVAHAAAATVLLTVAIVSLHFTAMGAITLIPDPSIVDDGIAIPPPVLSFLTAAAAGIILGMSLIGVSDRPTLQARTPPAKTGARHRARKHVAGALHVRCAGPYPVVQ